MLFLELRHQVFSFFRKSTCSVTRQSQHTWILLMPMQTLRIVEDSTKLMQTSKSVSQTVSQSVVQKVSSSVSQPVRSSFRPSISQFACLSVSLFICRCPSVSSSVCPSASQSCNIYQRTYTTVFTSKLEYQSCPKTLYIVLLLVKRKNKYLNIKFRIKRLDYFSRTINKNILPRKPSSIRRATFFTTFYKHFYNELTFALSLLRLY